MAQFTRTTTIDQHRGDHNSGMRVMELRDVTTDLSNHADRTWDELSEGDQAWWAEMVDRMHAIDVAIASLDADERAAVEEEFARTHFSGDLESVPGEMIYAAELALGRNIMEGAQ